MAKKFLNCEVYQLNSLVPEPVQSASDRMKGYNVIDNNANHIGMIDSIINYNQNHLLRIFQDKKEILVPWVEDIIISINHKKKEVRISVPEGLLDINNIII
jgi:16S rRNA processing protein RimM